MGRAAGNFHFSLALAGHQETMRRSESVRLRGPWASPGCTWSPDQQRLGGSRNTWKLTFALFTLRQR